MIATDLQCLLAFDGGDAVVLSVYLNLAPELALRRATRTSFDDLLKQAEVGLDETQRVAALAEGERVRAYLQGQVPAGRGLAIFSCSTRGLWQAYALPMAVAERVYVGPRPYLRPLLDILDEYERYAIALVDKEKARLFTVYLGEIEEQEIVTDVVPGKHEQGGWSQANYQRHHEAHVFWHLRHVVAELSALLWRQPFDRLVLAGPPEATTELKRLLPRRLRERLVGTFPAEIVASPAEILAKTSEIEREAERAAEGRLVGELLDAVFVGRGSLGLAPTLRAIRRGAVQRLVVTEAAYRAGAECPTCGLLIAERPANCPECGGTPRPLADVIERAVERTLQEGGLVETIHGAAATRLNEAGEGIGAFLRFPVEEAPPIEES